jgi:hypothetical protein
MPDNPTITTAVDQAAADILALINAQPRTPTQQEIALLIADRMGASLDRAGGGAIVARRSEWSRLRADYNAKSEVYGHDDKAESKDVADKAYERLEMLEDEIRALPPAGLADIAMLAEILFNRAYATGLPCTLLEPESEAFLAAGPHGQGGSIDEAMTVLLRAIRDLSRREAPGKVQVELQQIGDELGRLLPPLREAFDVVNDMWTRDARYSQANERWHGLLARYDALCKRAWDAKPSSHADCIAHLVLLAEIAQHDAYDWPAPHQQIPLTGGDYIDTDPVRVALGHLAMAVLRMGGRRHAVNVA